MTFELIFFFFLAIAVKQLLGRGPLATITGLTSILNSEQKHWMTANNSIVQNKNLVRQIFQHDCVLSNTTEKKKAYATVGILKLSLNKG